MTVSFRIGGIIRGAYGLSFRSMRTLAPATAIVFAVVLVGDVADTAMGKANGVMAVTSWWLILHAGIIVLVAPYKVMLYRLMWGANPSVAPTIRKRRRAILNIIALDLLNFLIGAVWIWLWNLRGEFEIPTVLVLALLVPIWCILTRLTLVGPVLTLDALPFTLAGALSATRGRVWRITLAGLLVGAAIVPVIGTFMLAIFWIQTAFLRSELIKPILMSPFSILSIAVQAELYRRMGLPSVVDTDRSA